MTSATTLRSLTRPRVGRLRFQPATAGPFEPDQVPKPIEVRLERLAQLVGRVLADGAGENRGVDPDEAPIVQEVVDGLLDLGSDAGHIHPGRIGRRSPGVKRLGRGQPP